MGYFRVQHKLEAPSSDSVKIAACFFASLRVCSSISGRRLLNVFESPLEEAQDQQGVLCCFWDPLGVLARALRSTLSVGSRINQAVLSELALCSQSLVSTGDVDIPETGEEVFVIEGSFTDELGEHRTWSWSRDLVQAYFGPPYLVCAAAVSGRFRGRVQLVPL